MRVRRGRICASVRMIASSRSRTYPVQVAPVAVQVDDRVTDELARPVVGRLAAAVGLDDVDLDAAQEVQLGLLRPAPERHDGSCSSSRTASGRSPALTASASARWSASASAYGTRPGQVQELRMQHVRRLPRCADVRRSRTAAPTSSGVPRSPRPSRAASRRPGSLRAADDVRASGDRPSIVAVDVGHGDEETVYDPGVVLPTASVSHVSRYRLGPS